MRIAFLWLESWQDFQEEESYVKAIVFLQKRVVNMCEEDPKIPFCSNLLGQKLLQIAPELVEHTLWCVHPWVVSPPFWSASQFGAGPRDGGS
jgi:hypothetical protein